MDTRATLKAATPPAFLNAYRRLRVLSKAAVPPRVVGVYRQLRGVEVIIPALIKRYCEGQGMEVGAGPNPYCSSENTIFLDRHNDNATGTPEADIVADAATIPKPDESFDFLLSAHCLEHVSDTIRTLLEWKRVLKPGGVLFLILPHAERTFDRCRSLTAFEHHLEDYEKGVGQLDWSHVSECEEGMRKLENLDEYVQAHQAVWGADFWDWQHRFENDAFHYHVWTQDEIVKLLQHVGLKIAYVNERVPERSDSFIVIGRKSDYPAIETN